MSILHQSNFDFDLLLLLLFFLFYARSENGYFDESVKRGSQLGDLCHRRSQEDRVSWALRRGRLPFGRAPPPVHEIVNVR